jgi:TfoX/Sxy family transcriptional regulator of competence genes
VSAMTDWEELVAGAEGGPVSRGSMFGSQGLRTGRKFFAIWWNDKLVLKLPAERQQELLDGDRAVPFEPMGGGRRMNGWVVVDDALDWPPLVEEARAYVESQAR